MITAYVLIQTDVGQAGRVARAAAEIDGVEQALPLAGPYDVIVRAEARNIDALGRLVVSRIQAINGWPPTLPRCRDPGAGGDPVRAIPGQPPTWSP